MLCIPLQIFWRLNGFRTLSVLPANQNASRGRRTKMTEPTSACDDVQDVGVSLQRSALGARRHAVASLMPFPAVHRRLRHRREIKDVFSAVDGRSDGVGSVLGQAVDVLQDDGDEGKIEGGDASLVLLF